MGRQLKLAQKQSWVESPAFDRSILAHHTMNDAGLAQEILGLFRQQLDHLQKADWAGLELGFEMHTLRGAAAAVGALQIEAVAADWRAHGSGLEQALKSAIQAFAKAVRP